MAKMEYQLTADFGALLDAIHDGVLLGSASATYEDGSDFQSGDTRCAVRVYERYSALGANRVSLSVTAFGVGTDLRVSAITSGGSKAVMVKMNTVGEEAFLDQFDKVLRAFQDEH